MTLKKHVTCTYIVRDFIINGSRVLDNGLTDRAGSNEL